MSEQLSSPATGRAYPITLVALLSINFGILFFDRNALSFLMPFIQKEWNLNNTQVGLLNAAIPLTWAISGVFIGRYCDRTGRKKSVLIISTLIFSVCSIFSGMASGFMALLLSRFLMGAAEGGVLPISQSLTVDAVPASHRGVAMGFMQNAGSMLLGLFLAPLVMVWLANHYGWRSAFFVSAIPGMITAFLMFLIIKAPKIATQSDAKTPKETLNFGILLGNRNIVLCMILASLLIGNMATCFAFMPLYLTSSRHLDPSVMSYIMAALGISAAIYGFALPWLSDRLGRKPIMIFVALIGTLLPLGALYFHGSEWSLTTILVIGWATLGLFPLFMATIPSESLGSEHTATALGLVMGTGEVFGGVLAPLISGIAADKWGLDAPLWLMAGLCLVASLVAIGLRETAPNRQRSI